MEWSQWAFLALGLMMSSIVIVQLALWTLQTYTTQQQTRQQFLLWQQRTRAQINQFSEHEKNDRALESTSMRGHWQGWRKFRVAKITVETPNARSIYLAPIDKKPFASWVPGQFLTLQLTPPDSAKSLVRCYSLSQAPQDQHYRITVKKVINNDKPAQVSISRFVNESLMVGDVIDLKPPSGGFVLDTETQAPVVLLAAGIGITPLFAMADWLTQQNSQRRILLLYGNRNGQEHLFRREIEALTQHNSNFFVLNCYSNPLETETLGHNYQVNGPVSVEVLKRILPNHQFQFYLCGPPGFMQSLYRDLTDWGVPESRIFFEAFGPASVKKVPEQVELTHPQPATAISAAPMPVTFSQSGKTANWESSSRTILDFGLEQGVVLDSGCCAGNCGQCAVRLLKGKVHYIDQPSAEIPPGHCLPCIACPDTEVILEA